MLDDHEGKPTFVCSGWQGPVDPLPEAPTWQVLLRFCFSRSLFSDIGDALARRWSHVEHERRYELLEQERERREDHEDNGEPRDA